MNPVRCKNPRRRGMILFTALTIAMIMMAWAVAAVQRANQVSSATRYSYRKSEAYYLAKMATSRALNQLNINPNWASTHTQLASADESTPNTKCWIEATSSPNSQVLRCQATVNKQVEYLNVPLLKQDPATSNMFSLTPPLGKGPDLVAWCTTDEGNWAALPPIPGVQRILSTTASPNGDVFSIGENAVGTRVFRYRTGQGWVQMPDPPTGLTLSSISAGGNNQLVCKGSDNSLLILPIGGTGEVSMQWDAVSPPSGTTLAQVAAHPLGRPLTYASATNSGGQPVVYQYNGDSKNWAQYPSPAPVALDAATGAPLPTPAQVSNLSGGITADKNGVVYAVSNTPNEASVVYAFKPDAPGASTGNWTALPPVPALEWQGTSIGVGSGFATNLSHVRSDDQGQLWAQQTDLNGRSEIVSLKGLP